MPLDRARNCGSGRLFRAEDIPSLRVRVGVWLMPDNRSVGALEQFLETLVATDDKLLPLAVESTATAKMRGADFPDSARSKAVLHAWLAWQTRPGVPYGTAIAARFFMDDSNTALAFVGWFKRLFGVQT